MSPEWGSGVVVVVVVVVMVVEALVGSPALLDRLVTVVIPEYLLPPLEEPTFRAPPCIPPLFRFLSATAARHNFISGQLFISFELAYTRKLSSPSFISAIC